MEVIFILITAGWSIPFGAARFIPFSIIVVKRPGEEYVIRERWEREGGDRREVFRGFDVGVEPVFLKKKTSQVTWGC